MANFLCGPTGRRALRACLVLVALAASASATAGTTPEALGVDFTGPATYTPGTDVGGVYVLTVTNPRATAITDLGVDVDVPAGVTGSWSCTATGTGSNCSLAPLFPNGDFSRSVDDIGAGGTLAYTFNPAAYASSMSTPTLTFSAQVTDTEATPNVYSDSVSSDIDRQTDFSVAFDPAHPTSSPGTYTPGVLDVALDIDVANAGPSDPAGSATVSMAMPGTATATYTCSVSARCTPQSGNWTGSVQVSLDDGEAVSIRLLIDYPSDMSNATIDYVASVSEPDDTASGNDSATNRYTLARRTDFAVAFDPGHSPGSPGDYVPGSTGNTSVLQITNSGPSDSASNGAALTLVPPNDGASPTPQVVAGIASWACVPAAACSPSNGTGTPAPDISLGAGNTVDLTLTYDYASGLLEPSVRIDADIASVATDTVAANDTASDHYAIDRQADIEVLKTASRAVINPGTSFHYDIVLTNNGPSDIGHGGPSPPDPDTDPGLLLSDAFPGVLGSDATECGAQATEPCWKYCSDGGAPGTCGDTEGGSGDLVDEPFPLPAGASITVRVYASVGPTASGQVDNTATVTLGGSEVTELTPGTGNSSTASVDIEVSSDIGVDKTDNATSAVPGTQHSYQIEVRNFGFIAANAVLVDDDFPLFLAEGDAGFVPGTASWQCRAFSGACCNSNSSNCGTSAPTAPIAGNALADHAIDLPGQSHVVFTVTGMLHAAATGTLSNTASITLPGGIIDTDPSNDSDTDDDTVLSPQAALQIDKSVLSLVGAQAPYQLQYELLLTNAGPSRVVGAAVVDQLNDVKLDTASASWTCAATVDPGGTGCDESTGTGAIDTTVDLDVGGAIRFLIDIDTTGAAAGEVTNLATVTSPAGSDEDSITSSLAGEADLAISKTDNLSTARPGTAVEYLVRVQNIGGDDAFGARVVDEFARELEDATWTCTATTPVPGDLEALDEVGAANTAGHALALSADGRHAYQVATAIDTLFVYQRDNVPGAGFGDMAPLEAEVQGVNDVGDPGATVSGMDGPIDVALASAGNRVYVLSPGSIAMFDRVTNPANPEHGEVSFAGSVLAGVPAAPREMVVTAQNLYVSAAGRIAVFRLDPVSGLPQFDQDHAIGGWEPGPLAVDPQQGLLFAAGTTVPSLRLFAIGAGGGAIPPGRLTEAASLSHADLAGASDLAVGPGGGQLYVAATGAAKLAVVDYTPTSLASNTSYDDATAEVLALGLPADPFGAPMSIAIAPDGEHLFLSSRASWLLVQFRRDTLGGLLTAEAFVQRAAGTQPAGQVDEAVVTADGRHLLFASGNPEGPPLEVFSRRAPDPLFALIELDRQGQGTPPVSGLLAPTDVAISPDGQHVYAVSLPDDAIAQFRRFATQGLAADTAGQHLQFERAYLQGDPGIDGLDGAHRIRVSPDGDRVYVTSELGNSLAVFARDDDAMSADFGRLTLLRVLRDGIDGFNGLSGATGIAIDVNSSRVYVAAAFDDAISVFGVVGAPDYVQLLGEVRGGLGGVTGMDGITDIAISRDNAQLLGVSSTDNRLVVFNRTTTPGPDYGALAFVHAPLVAAGGKPVSLALPQGGPDPTDNVHVYIAAENSDQVVVMRRVTDPSSPDFRHVLPAFTYQNNAGVITHMDGPRDIVVGPDGKRVYVAARNSNAVLIFDRDLNSSSANHGGLALVETRRDGVDGVDGIDTVYALAVSGDARNVYAAGFDDQAIASFAVGSGSSCSAGGSGSIDDRVNIGSGGTVEYRVNATIRPDATGTLENTAAVLMPSSFNDPDLGNNTAIDLTTLVPEGDLSVSKTNGQVSVVAGQPVTYEVVVRNPGPSNLAHTPGTPVTLSDPLSAADGFVPESASWTCTASGSGALDFVDVHVDGDPQLDALTGVSGLALVQDPDGGGPLGAYLAAASVLDNSLTLLRRDPLDGRLLPEATVVHGGVALAGARAVAASGDGRFVYVASRTSDAITVFRLDAAAGLVSPTHLQTVQGVLGLDQALHLALSPDGAHLYVSGANDNAVAVFARDDTTGLLTWVESEIDGVNDPGDAGGTVDGLENVQFVVVSPDGAHLYALTGTGAGVALFDRDPATGALSFRSVRRSADFGVPLDGASSATFDAAGETMYLTATTANRVVVLARESTPGGTFGRLSFASSIVHGVAGNLGLLGPRRALLSGDEGHLYVVGQAGASVAWFLRDPLDGSLRYLGQRSNQSAGVSGLAGATGLAIDDDLGQVYVSGTLDDALVHFERHADSFCPPSGSGPLVDVPFNIAAGGTVTFTIDVDVATTLVGNLVNTVTVHAAQDPEPGNNSATDTDVDTAQADLWITKDDGLAEFDGLAGANAIAGDGRHLYVAGAGDNAIGVFARVEASGQPQHGAVAFASVVRGGVDGALGLSAVADLALAVGGDQVYAVSPADNSIATYRRDDVSGALAFAGIHQNGVLGVTGLAGARALATSPDGSHIYVAGAFSNSVAVFARDADPGSASYGLLAFRNMVQNGVGGVAGIGAPIDLVVSADGKHVYVLGTQDDSVALFTRNPNPGSSSFGELAFVAQYIDGAGGIDGLGGARSLALGAGGAHLYVLGSAAAPGTGAIARFSRDSGSGALAFAGDVRDGEGGIDGLAGATGLLPGPGGNTLYVAADADDAVLRFTIDGAGALALGGRIGNGDPAPQTGGQVLGLDGVRALHIDADGEHLYSVSALDAALASFDRDGSDGALDFRAVLFDGLGGVAPGEPVSYIIEAGNNGPSDVTARVIDVFPQAFTSVAWTCSGTDGGQCAGGGSGNLDQAVNLPVGGRVAFVATGTIGESATGRLVNSATIASIGAIDPDQSNNSATDDDTVLSPASDLVVSVDDGAGSSIPGGSIVYEVGIANLGPSYAAGVTIGDAVPPALLDVGWTCSATPIAGVLGYLSQVDVALSSYRALRLSSLGRFAYAVGNGGGGAIAVYRRDPLSGALFEDAVYTDGSDGIAGLVSPADLVLTSDERFLYVAAEGADAVLAFARDADTGALDFLAAYQDGDFGIDGIGGVRALALSPDGARLYAAGALDDAIAVFSVDATSGLLAQVGVVAQTQPGVDGLNGVTDLAFSADGAHLFAVARDNLSLAAFSRAPGSGLLSPAGIVQNFELDDDQLLDPVAVAVDGARILVAAAGGDRVAQFAFGADEGFSLEWTIAEGSGGVAGMVAPRALLFVPEQARLYVAAADSVHLFSLLDSTPALLASYDPGDEAALAGVAGLALAPGGTQLYAFADAPSADITVFARERGSRCPLAGSGPLDGQSVDIAPGGAVHFVLAGDIFANASGLLDYTVTATPRIAGEEINPADNTATDSNLLTPAPDLSIAKDDGLAQVTAGTALTWRIDLANAGVSDALAALVGDAAPVFPGDAAGLLPGSGSFSCAANAPLAYGEGVDAGAVPGLAGVAFVALSPDRTRLYAVNPQHDSLLVFPRAGDGTLGTPEAIADGQALGSDTVAGLDGASSVAVTPDGLHVLVTGANANSLAVFAVDPDTGAHAFVQRMQSGVDGVAGLLGAAHVVVSRDGARVFVASSGSHAIAVFRRDADDGLAFVERVADGLGTILPDSNVIRGVRRLHLSADGRTLYAVAPTSQAVSSFEVDPGTGTLDYLGKLRQGEGGMDGLAGARDIAAAPGDRNVYVLGTSAINLLQAQADGTLAPVARYDGIAQLGGARALALDTEGSRLYVADDAGAVHVFARDWSNGLLDLRHRFTAALPAIDALVYARDSDLYLAAGAPGRIDRLDELALSRCLQASGSADQPLVPIDLGVGGEASVDFTATVHPSARGTVSNTATIAPSDGGDPAPADNSAGDSTVIVVASDLSVAKSGPTLAVAGEPIAYTITVGNAGPSSALGVRVVDDLVPALTGASWTCSASAGSSCPASGNGDLDMAADLLPDGTLTIVVDATIDPAFLGTLPNTVTLVPEAGASDPNPGDEAASTDTEVVAEVDVSVTKSNGVSTVIAGLPVSWTITVSNAGPSDAPQVRLVDNVSADILGATWACSGTGTASCPASGTGSILATASVPAGASVSFVLTGQLSPAALGTLVNTATASLLDEANEVGPGDESATDTDTIEQRSDLAVELVSALDPFDPAGAGPLPMTARMRNLGPSRARNATLTIEFPTPVLLAEPPGCTLDAFFTLNCTLAELPANGTLELFIPVANLPPAPGSYTITGSVATADPDPVAGNNTVELTVQLASGGDVVVSVDNGVDGLIAGREVRYTIGVRNAGSQAVTGIDFDAPLAPELVGASWTCSGTGGASCTPSGAGNIADTLSLGRGQGVVYVLDAVVDPTLDPNTSQNVAQGADAVVAPGSDFNLANNTAGDDDPVVFIVFGDGFETPPPPPQLTQQQQGDR